MPPVVTVRNAIISIHRNPENTWLGKVLLPNGTHQADVLIIGTFASKQMVRKRLEYYAQLLKFVVPRKIQEE